jgi:hypothetical protein
MGVAKRLIESKGLKRTNLLLQKAAGVLIVGIGLYFLIWR